MKKAYAIELVWGVGKMRGIESDIVKRNDKPTVRQTVAALKKRVEESLGFSVEEISINVSECEYEYAPAKNVCGTCRRVHYGYGVECPICRSIVER